MVKKISGLASYLTNEEIAKAVEEDYLLIIPIGTLESNGPHQLLGADYLISEKLAQYVASKTNSLYLPSIQYGVSELHKNLVGTFSLNGRVFEEIVISILESAYFNGFKKVLIINCHIPNHYHIESASRKLRREKKLLTALIDPIEVIKDIAWTDFKSEEEFNKGHGGEPLASLIYYFYPEFFRPDRLGTYTPNKIHGLDLINSSRYEYKGSRVGIFPGSEEINNLGAWTSLNSVSSEKGKEAFDKLKEFTISFAKEMMKWN